jgi:hypothetical protein
MDLKQFAIQAIELSEKFYEEKRYAQAAAKLEILRQELERQIKTIEKEAAKTNA